MVMFAVRVRAEPLAVVAQRRSRRVEMAVGLPDVLGLEQQAHRYGRQTLVAEPLDSLDVVRARRPGEVVDVVRRVVMRRRAGRPRRARRASVPVAPTIQPFGTVSLTS